MRWNRKSHPVPGACSRGALADMMTLPGPVGVGAGSRPLGMRDAGTRDRKRGSPGSKTGAGSGRSDGMRVSGRRFFDFGAEYGRVAGEIPAQSAADEC